MQTPVDLHTKSLHDALQALPIFFEKSPEHLKLEKELQFGHKIHKIAEKNRHIASKTYGLDFFQLQDGLALSEKQLQEFEQKYQDAINQQASKYIDAKSDNKFLRPILDSNTTVRSALMQKYDEYMSLRNDSTRAKFAQSHEHIDEIISFTNTLAQQSSRYITKKHEQTETKKLRYELNALGKATNSSVSGWTGCLVSAVTALSALSGDVSWNDVDEIIYSSSLLGIIGLGASRIYKLQKPAVTVMNNRLRQASGLDMDLLRYA